MSTANLTMIYICKGCPKVCKFCLPLLKRQILEPTIFVKRRSLHDIILSSSEVFSPHVFSKQSERKCCLLQGLRLFLAASGQTESDENANTEELSNHLWHWREIESSRNTNLKTTERREAITTAQPKLTRV